MLTMAFYTADRQGGDPFCVPIAFGGRDQGEQENREKRNGIGIRWLTRIRKKIREK